MGEQGKGLVNKFLVTLKARVDQVALGDNLQEAKIVIDVYDPQDKLLSIDRKIDFLRALMCLAEVTSFCVLCK